MSIAVSMAVWERSNANLADRLVMLSIAERCNDDGSGAYPSVLTIAKSCKLSERTVREAIFRLNQMGELTVETGCGPHGTNRYTINLDKLGTAEAPKHDWRKSDEDPAKIAPLQETPPANPSIEECKDCTTPLQTFPFTPAKIAPNTSIEPSIEPSTEPSVEPTPSSPPKTPKTKSLDPNYTPEFDEFWSIYPKGRGTKSKAFALWKELNPSPGLQAVIISAVHAWKRSELWQKDRQKFVVWAERFLERRYWENVPEPAPLPPLPPPLQKRVEVQESVNAHDGDPPGYMPEGLKRDITNYYASLGVQT